MNNKWIKTLSYNSRTETVNVECADGRLVSTRSVYDIQISIAKPGLRFFMEWDSGHSDIYRLNKEDMQPFLAELLSLKDATHFLRRCPTFFSDLIMDVCAYGDVVLVQQVVDFYLKSGSIKLLDKSYHDSEGVLVNKVTPLTKAAASGFVEIVDVLLRAGVNPLSSGFENVFNASNKPVPLSRVVILADISENKKVAVLARLIQSGVPVKIKDVLELGQPERVLNLLYPDIAMKKIKDQVVLARGLTATNQEAAKIIHAVLEDYALDAYEATHPGLAAP